MPYSGAFPRRGDAPENGGKEDMSSFIGDARSNVFCVKDIEAFKKWAAEWEFEIEEYDEGQVSMLRYDYGYPWHPEFAKELSAHLAGDSVAIFMQAGMDCSGYPSASAIAVNSEGQSVTGGLENIYRKAKKLGGTFEEL
jgi:hypothetical protein